MAGTNDIKEELVNTLNRPDDMPFILPPPLAPETTATSLSRSSRSYSHRSKTVSGALQSSSTSPEKKIPVSMTEKKMGHMVPPKSTTNLPLRKTESTISSAKQSDVDSAKGKQELSISIARNNFILTVLTEILFLVAIVACCCD